MNNPQKIQNLKREIRILKFCKHQNIMKLFETMEGTKHVYLITEYVSQVSLKKYLKK